MASHQWCLVLFSATCDFHLSLGSKFRQQTKSPNKFFKMCIALRILDPRLEIQSSSCLWRRFSEVKKTRDEVEEEIENMKAYSVENIQPMSRGRHSQFGLDTNDHRIISISRDRINFDEDFFDLGIN